MTLLRTRLHRRTLATAALAAALVSLLGPATAQHAGFHTLTLAGDTPTTVALFYPTTAPELRLIMGPWQPSVAPGAPAVEGPVKGLILVSHGSGGTELNHHNLATRLARDGYLVAALRHPGDNWQDRSMLASGSYLSERPRQLSRLLDALLASSDRGPRIPVERIGAIGHSAGGYSVLALAGAQAQASRLTRHCQAAPDDPVFCELTRDSIANPATHAETETVSVPDPRIRAVVALAPMAIVFTPESLAAIRVPLRLMTAEQDQVLAGQYHGARIAAWLPAAQTTVVAGAGHFAFMAPSRMPLPSSAGDAAADPAGFDRPAFLIGLEDQVAAFFAAHWPN